MKTKELITQCCECRKVRISDRWVTMTPPPNRLYTHGYCPSCFEHAMAEAHLLPGTRPPATSA